MLLPANAFKKLENSKILLLCKGIISEKIYFPVILALGEA